MTKVEEVALAIGALNGSLCSQDGVNWEWASQVLRTGCHEVALAAITAMREPNNDMIGALAKKYVEIEARNERATGLAQIFPQDLGELYDCAIGAALGLGFP